MARMTGGWLRQGLVWAVLLATGWCAEEAEAQLFRGRASRGPSQWSAPSSPNWSAAPQRGADEGMIRPAEANSQEVDPAARDVSSRDVSSRDVSSRNATGHKERPVPQHYHQQDWRRDPAARGGTPAYPKYFGGFHSSHYYDLGIPNGDKGFRGNGVYWTPW